MRRLVALAVIALTACANVESDFVAADHEGTLEAYEEFLAAYEGRALSPTNREYVAMAQDRICKLDFESAQAVDTTEAFRAFIEAHPDNRRVEDALERIEELDWGVARDAGTAEALRGYLERYPDGAHAEKARERLAALSAE